MSYLYIAKFKDQPNSFKIGVASDYKERLSKLEVTHGKLDKEFTEVIRTKNKKTAIKIETLLHFSFRSSKDNSLSKCDGYTEFLKDECYREVIAFIDSNMVDGNTIQNRINYLVAKNEKSKLSSSEIETEIRKNIDPLETTINEYEFKTYTLNRLGKWKNQRTIKLKHYYWNHINSSIGFELFSRKTNKRIKLFTLEYYDFNTDEKLSKEYVSHETLNTIRRLEDGWNNLK